MSSNYPTGLDAFATDVDNITTISATEANNKSASIVALEKFGRPVVNLVGFGGKGDNGTDNSPAMAAALTALPSTGGTIYIPASANAYLFGSAWNLVGKSFIRIAGAGPTSGGGSATSALVRFTTTTGPLIAASGSTGMEMEDLFIQWPAAFTGTVVDYSSNEGACLRRCFFGANGGGASAALIVGLDNTNRTLIERCRFHNVQVAVQGLATAGHFSVATVIRDCNFNSSSGDISSACISNPHQNWVIIGNVFEMGQGAGNMVAVATPLSSGQGVTYLGNWTGDQGANAVTQVNAGNGWLISGSYFGGASTTTAIAVPNSAAGISITGNEFQTFSVGVLVGTSVNRFHYAGNIANSVTTEISGTPNSGGQVFTSGTQTLYGATAISGGLALTSSLQHSITTPAFVASFTPACANGEQVEVTLTGNITVNAPTGGAHGMKLVFVWTQDATGGRTITYNAVYKTGGGAALVTTLSTTTVDVFECMSDNTTWRLVSRITGQ